MCSVLPSVPVHWVTRPFPVFNFVKNSGDQNLIPVIVQLLNQLRQFVGLLP